MIKIEFVCYASVSWCDRKICSIKSMERRLLDLTYSCSCLSVFVIGSFFGQMVNYVEFPCYLRSAEPGAQKYYKASLFGRY
jgi:hypothetical protein